MKRRICILLLAVLILLLPHAASANAPVREPRLIRIEYTGVDAAARIDAVLLKEDGKTRVEEDLRRTGQSDAGDLYFRFENDETAFYLVCTGVDGTEARTETVRLIEYGNYLYDGVENRLSENGTYYNAKDGCTAASALGTACRSCIEATLLYSLLGLLLPIALTLLIEWLTALCFGIRPVGHVIAINAITNPSMNILLLISSLMLSVGNTAYWIILAVLEILVVFIEFAYYTQHYPGIPKKRLLLFSITANMLSLAAGVLLLYFLL